MNRLTLSLSLLALAACGAPDPVDARPPDVVLIVIDTQRADRLGLYGYERPTSPALDRLGAGGLVFEDATSQSPWTQPSMASLFTGRHLSIQITAPEPAAPTLAEVFADAGYVTCGISGNILLSNDSGFERGFERFDAAPGFIEGPNGKTLPRGRHGHEIVPATFDLLPEGLDDPDRPPLFLWVQLFDPHTPYNEQPHWDAALPLDGLNTPDALAWQRANYPRPRFAQMPPDQGPWGVISRLRAVYDQEVREADAWLGRLLEGLAERGVGDNAVFALTSDHGECLWDHRAPAEAEGPVPAPTDYYYQEHGAVMFREAVHVPLVLWGRGVPSGVRHAEPVEVVDLTPTLYDLAGVERPQGLDGHNLLELASGALPTADYIHSLALGRSMVRETASDLTLLMTAEGRLGAGMELYDLTRDPDQRTDLAAERPADLERLLAAHEAWNAANPVEFTSTKALTDADRERLRALGYGEIQLDGLGGDGE
ncbi:MAG: sulfatase [Planctomycetota bacterium]